MNDATRKQSVELEAAVQKECTRVIREIERGIYRSAKLGLWWVSKQVTEGALKKEYWDTLVSMFKDRFGPQGFELTIQRQSNYIVLDVRWK